MTKTLTLVVGRYRGLAAATTMVMALTLATSNAQDVKMNLLAEQYVRLVLAVGQHDTDYVDAYYGPPEWRTEAEAQKLPRPEIATRATALAAALGAARPPAAAGAMTPLRPQHPPPGPAALRTRVAMLMGRKLK